jgi:hypothetical protein
MPRRAPEVFFSLRGQLTLQEFPFLLVTRAIRGYSLGELRHLLGELGDLRLQFLPRRPDNHFANLFKLSASLAIGG